MELNDIDSISPDGPNPWREHDVLYELYVNRELGTNAIGDLLDCSHDTVLKWLRKNDIEVRPPKSEYTPDEIDDTDYLHDLYLKRGLTIDEIADKVGCSRFPIGQRLRNNPDISLREGGTSLDKINKHQSRTPDGVDFPWRSHDLLADLYVVEDLTPNQISNRWDCSHTTIRTWIDRHGIEEKPAENATPEELTQPEFLRRLYWDNRLSATSIADKLSCSPSTVIKWLREHEIKVRPSHDKHTPEQLKDRRYFETNYLDKKKSFSEIARDLNCGLTTVTRWARRHDIETQQRHLSGSDHPNWNGGQFPYGAGWDEEKKERVRESQNRLCAGCGTHESEFETRLPVHHIEKARSLLDSPPEVRNGEDNLIALCRSCHRKWESMSPLRPQTMT